MAREHLENWRHVDVAIEEIVVVELDRVGTDLPFEEIELVVEAVGGGNAVAPPNIAATPQNVQRNGQPSAA